jgi:transposase
VHWFNRWERLGIVGLQDSLRSGRPKKLTPEEQRPVQHLFKVHARAPKRIAGEIFKQAGKQVSVDTIRRLGKKTRLLWKRIRQSLKDKLEMRLKTSSPASESNTI